MDFISTFLLSFGLITMFFLLNIFWSENKRKKQKNRTQQAKYELQSKIDDMTPREFYTNKMSQASLIWDPRTQAYIKKWSKNDTTYH